MPRNIFITDRKKAVSFTGHRRIAPPEQFSLFGSGEQFCGGIPSETGDIGSYTDSVRTKLAATLEKLTAEGFDTFLCGMATGFDLMAGSVVCDMIDGGARVSVVAAIPFPEQAERFGSADREVYQRILSYAAMSHTVCPGYRHDCYHLRNDYLVENASVLVGFYNGSAGGTHYTVKKAFREGLRIINLF